MSIIRVEGHEIETRDIVKIEDAGHRMCGFRIILVGPRVIYIAENEPYDMTPGDVGKINDRYRALQEKVEAKWEEDKSDIETFNL